MRAAPPLPAPPELQPPADRHGGDDGRRPAPVGGILAALARITSHAGDPSSLTITAPGNAVAVAVDRFEEFTAWQYMLALAGAPTHEPHFDRREVHAVLHGWALTVRLVGCS